MFHSDADSFIAQTEFSELAKQLQADVHVIPGAGHFADQDEFPQLTDYIFETYR